MAGREDDRHCSPPDTVVGIETDDFVNRADVDTPHCSPPDTVVGIETK